MSTPGIFIALAQQLDAEGVPNDRILVRCGHVIVSADEVRRLAAWLEQLSDVRAKPKEQP